MIAIKVELSMVCKGEPARDSRTVDATLERVKQWLADTIPHGSIERVTLKRVAFPQVDMTVVAVGDGAGYTVGKARSDCLARPGSEEAN